MNQLETLQAALDGRYALEREVGAGGMATVFLARDLRHERRVALKVLKPELGAVLGVEWFLAEIRVTAQLQHPNILPLFDSGEADGLLFYVMPYVDGETLRARLVREKQLPVDAAVAIARAIASALDYAHSASVIHRDLKPENILFQAGEPVLADFGIALAVANAGGTRITQTGLSLGTPQYMSPEQATGDRVIDGRTDIYSLGAVLYEMLSGEPPHTGTTAQAIIARLLTDRPRSVRASRDMVPPHVEAAVERALAKLPADRFATAREFAQALGGAGYATTAGMTSGAATPGQIQVSFAIPKATLARAAKYAAVATAVAVGAWGWLRTTEPPTAMRARFTFELPDSLRPNSILGQQSLVISPDGTELVYPGTNRSGPVLFRRRLNDLSVTTIAGSEGFLNPRYSPDSKWLAVETSTGALTKFALTGGPGIPIADSVSRPTWGDNDLIVFTRGGALWRVSSSGGGESRVTMVDSTAGEAQHGWPFALPGGRSVLFNIFPQVGGPDEFEVAVADVADGSIKRLGLKGSNPRYVNSGHILVSRQDGTVLAAPFDLGAREVRGDPVPVLERVMVKSGGAGMFSVSESGVLVFLSGEAGGRPTTVDTDGRVTALGFPLGNYGHPRISPNGDRVVVQRNEEGRFDIWVLTKSSGQIVRLTRDGRSLAPEWSADGRRIFWITSDSGGSVLRSARADAAGVPETIPTPSRSFLHFDVAPNGRFLAVVDGPSNLRDITMVPLDSTQQVRKLANSRVSDIDPSISPDSRWLAFVNSETGGSEVYVSSIEHPETRIQVSNEGIAGEPRWMPDGRTLVYRTGRHFVSAEFSFTPSIEVIQRDTLLLDTFFAGTNSGRNLDIRRPNEFIVLSRGDRESDRMNVVIGWLDELKERMAAAGRK